MKPSPLFRDPVHDGAADPVIIYSPHERAWLIFYTNRRADVEEEGFSWVHGTDIGIASSSDGGRSWHYRGIARGLEIEEGLNTFWAPEILFADGLYHMYVSYVRGTPATWDFPRRILHYTSADLGGWTFRTALDLSSDRVIDACVHRLPGGRWRMWYKDEVDGSFIHAADSEDLYRWEPVGAVLRDRPQEGPNVFSWK
ncbi:MAG: hypothetical protein Q8M76_08035, partial [Spirochaetaceae bacterium]|nr:hypothetical protein [Spirochaetaceae bacterium]